MADTLVERFRERLERRHWPRIHCVLLITLASATAFLLSVVLLKLNVGHMAVRYGVAAAGGYAAFLLLIGAWVRWKGSRLVRDVEPDLIDVGVDVALSVPTSPSSDTIPTGMFEGGRTGGGGASASWGPPRAMPVAASRSSSSAGRTGGFTLDLDADDLVWVLVALAAALAGLVAVAYVIYVAPILLAEAAVNAAIVGKVYRGMRKHDDSHWTTHVLKRTAASAIVLVVCAIVAGYALQRIAPEARSIGGVWQHLADR